MHPRLLEPKATADPATEMCNQLETFIQRSYSGFAAARLICPAAHILVTELESVPLGHLDPSLHMVSPRQLSQHEGSVHFGAQSTVMILEMAQWRSPHGKYEKWS